MHLNELGPAEGSTHRSRRVGRGNGSGRGTYSGRGSKGQKAHHKGVRLGFEGGQLPLIKRLPRKRGFTNVFRIEFNVVNVSSLNVFPEGAEVSPKEMKDAGLIHSLARPTKILGHGSLEKRLSVLADSFSVTAEEKIKAAQGTVRKA
ncbi:MAG: 50S ribosomal protein L15 [Dehalococcoidia bacterium]|nr:MAG: 50S ribosomal protein L15 [Dehalococcoidia bacterium]